jgi:hypothetical protein
VGDGADRRGFVRIEVAPETAPYTLRDFLDSGRCTRAYIEQVSPIDPHLAKWRLALEDVLKFLDVASIRSARSRMAFVH